MSSPKHNAFSQALPAAAAARGFSLIELLSVLAVIGIVSALVLPSVGSVGRAAKLGAGVFSVAGMLEQARAHAMARNTHVWVSVAPAVDQSGQEDGVFVTAFASLDRTADLRSENLVALGRPVRVRGALLSSAGGTAPRNGYQGTGLVNLAGLGMEPRAKAPTREEIADVSSAPVLVRIDPRGSFMIREGAAGDWETFRWLEIGLTDFKQSSGAASDNFTSVQIAGLTGQVMVYR